MECYYHEKKAAASTCSNCGKGLCRECGTFLEPPTAFKKQNQQ